MKLCLGVAIIIALLLVYAWIYSYARKKLRRMKK